MGGVNAGGGRARLIRAAAAGVLVVDREGIEAMAQETDAETAASLAVRAERCRALARVAYLPMTAQMLVGLAQQLDGEAQRKNDPRHGSEAA